MKNYICIIFNAETSVNENECRLPPATVHAIFFLFPVQIAFFSTLVIQMTLVQMEGVVHNNSLEFHDRCTVGHLLPIILWIH